MKTQLIHYSGFSDPELERQLTSEHTETKRNSSEAGRDFARKGQPAIKGDNLPVYTGSITARYDEMPSRIKGRLQPETTEREIKALKDKTEEKLRTLETNKQKAVKELFNFEDDLKHNKGISTEDLAKVVIPVTPKLISVFLAVIGIAEWFFTATGLQGIGHNFLVALLISAGITIALYFLARFLGKHLKQYPGGKTKTVITIIACVLAIGIFIAIAILRSEILKEQDDTNISPLFLVLFGLLFFAVTTWHYFRISLTAREKELIRYRRQWEELKAQVAEAESIIQNTKEDLAERLNLLMHKPGYTKYLLERVNIWKEEAIQDFIASNISSRPDQKVPDCFISKKRKGIMP